jgi:hypothetical protein
MLLIPEGENYEAGKLQKANSFRRQSALDGKVDSFASFADDLIRKTKYVYLLQN